MSERLKELQRQRALAQEQLAWFDREIARESSGQPQVPLLPDAGAPLAPAKEPVPADPDRIIEQYQGSGTSIKSEVRQGCFLYFFGAFAVLGLALLAYYFLWRR